jgi:hypothetical protein
MAFVNSSLSRYGVKEQGNTDSRCVTDDKIYCMHEAENEDDIVNMRSTVIYRSRSKSCNFFERGKNRESLFLK